LKASPTYIYCLYCNIAAEGQNYIVLQWTGNAGSADLYGKASDNAPVLLITTSNETLYTATFTETNSLTPAVTIYSEAETSTTVTIGADGWATLFTDKALNFAGSGLKAYTATCEGSTVTLTEVTTVPANTGVVLKGEAGNYDVAVVATSATEKGNLQGSATAATAYDAFEGYELYALAMNGDEAQFCQVASGEIAAGKAFLKVAEETEVSALSIVFGETDGIEALTIAENETSNAMFDLSGRRVLKAQKGIYVKNGKKVIF